MGSSADEGPSTTPGRDVGPQTLAILLPLFAVSLIVYTIRIWTRARPKPRLNAADYTITVAMMAETISIIFTIVAVANGFGRPGSSLTPREREAIGVTTFVVFIAGLFASCFGRISVACLLLQFTQARVWRVVLWIAIVFQGLLLLGCGMVMLLQCRPIRAMWADVPDAKCISPQQNWTMGYLFSGVGMFSDILFAVLPLLLIWRLSRSPVERLLISALLGLGLLGVVASAVKVVTLQGFRIGSPNVVADMMPVYLWSRIEEIVLIIAACAPLLKVPVEALLHRRFGLRLFYPATRGLDTVPTALPSGVAVVGRGGRGGRSKWWYAWSSLRSGSSTGATATASTLTNVPITPQLGGT